MYQEGHIRSISLGIISTCLYSLFQWLPYLLQVTFTLLLSPVVSPVFLTAPLPCIIKMMFLHSGLVGRHIVIFLLIEYCLVPRSPIKKKW
jgi:hypothetical protein